MTAATEKLILQQLREIKNDVANVETVVRDGLAAAHKRINPMEAWQAGATEKFNSLRGRINWLYFIVGGLVVGCGVALVSKVVG